jgi:hypothetical protein
LPLPSDIERAGLPQGLGVLAIDLSLLLVFFLTGDKESYVFALTREGFDRRTIGIGAENLSEKVAALRTGLDLDKLQKSGTKPVLFDLALAHELYVALIGPVEALVKDKAARTGRDTKEAARQANDRRGSATARGFHSGTTSTIYLIAVHRRSLAKFRVGVDLPW